MLFNLPNKFNVNRINVFQTLQHNFYINYVKPRRDPLKTVFWWPWNILLGNLSDIIHYNFTVCELNFFLLLT